MLGLTLTFIYGKFRFAFWAFLWREFVEHEEDLGANVNKTQFIK